MPKPILIVFLAIVAPSTFLACGDLPEDDVAKAEAVTSEPEDTLCGDIGPYLVGNPDDGTYTPPTCPEGCEPLVAQDVYGCVPPELNEGGHALVRCVPEQWMGAYSDEDGNRNVVFSETVTRLLDADGIAYYWSTTFSGLDNGTLDAYGLYHPYVSPPDLYNRAVDRYNACMAAQPDQTGTPSRWHRIAPLGPSSRIDPEE